MTTDLPDPHGCPHCGHAGLAERWGETICGMCGAPRVHATPGCPVRNAVAADGETRVLDLRTMKFRTIESLRQDESLSGTIARERRVHDGGPRINP